jgi:hypothetical protein
VVTPLGAVARVCEGQTVSGQSDNCLVPSGYFVPANRASSRQRVVGNDNQPGTCYHSYTRCTTRILEGIQYNNKGPVIP